MYKLPSKHIADLERELQELYDALDYASNLIGPDPVLAAILNRKDEEFRRSQRRLSIVPEIEAV